MDLFVRVLKEILIEDIFPILVSAATCVLLSFSGLFDGISPDHVALASIMLIAILASSLAGWLLANLRDYIDLILARRHHQEAKSHQHAEADHQDDGEGGALVGGQSQVPNK